ANALLASADDRITITCYGMNGLRTAETDAVGNVTTYTSDLQGNITLKSITRKDANAVTSTDVTTYIYDQSGRQTRQSVYNVAGSNTALPATPTAIQTQEVQYNTFGELTGKRTYGGNTAPTWQEITVYDKAGHAISSSAATGVTKGYLFDANGNATLVIESTAADLSGLSIDAMLARDDFYKTASSFDRRNQLSNTYKVKQGENSDNFKTIVSGGALGGVAVVAQKPMPALANIDSVDQAPWGDIWSKPIGIGVDFFGDPSSWDAYFRVSVPDTSLLGSGFVTVEYSDPNNSAIPGMILGVVKPEGGGSPTKGYRMIGYADSGAFTDSGTISIYKDINGEKINISGPIKIIQSDFKGLAWRMETPSISPIVYLKQNSNAQKLVILVREKNSGGAWSQAILDPVLKDFDKGNIFVLNSGQLLSLEAGKYEMEQISLDTNGVIVGRIRSDCTKSDSGINTFQTSATSGAEGWAHISTDGYLNIAGQGFDTTTARLTLQTKDGESTILLSSVAGKPPGWFQVNPKIFNLSAGAYTYQLSSQNGQVSGILTIGPDGSGLAVSAQKIDSGFAGNVTLLAQGNIHNGLTQFSLSSPKSVTGGLGLLTSKLAAPAAVSYYSMGTPWGVSLEGTVKSSSNTLYITNVDGSAFGSAENSIIEPKTPLDNQIYDAPPLLIREIRPGSLSADGNSSDIYISNFGQKINNNSTIGKGLITFKTSASAFSGSVVYHVYRAINGIPVYIGPSISVTPSSDGKTWNVTSAEKPVTTPPINGISSGVLNITIPAVGTAELAHFRMRTNISASLSGGATDSIGVTDFTGLTGSSLSVPLVLLKTGATFTGQADVRLYKVIDGKEIEVYGGLRISPNSDGLSWVVTSLPLPPITIFGNLPQRASDLVLSYRVIDSNDVWKQMALPAIMIEPSSSGFYLKNSLLAQNSYEIRYQTVDEFGSVLSSSTGTMVVSSSGVSVTQSRVQSGGGGSALMTTDGSIIVNDQGRYASTANLRLRPQIPANSAFLASKTLTPANVGGKPTQGWFQIDTTTLAAGGYDYVLESLAADGITVVNRVFGSFTRGSANTVTTPKLSTFGVTSSVDFLNQPENAVSSRLLYRGASIPSETWKSTVLKKTGWGGFSWDVLNLMPNPPRDYTFKAEFFDADDLLINSSEGIVNLGLDGINIKSVGSTYSGSDLAPNLSAPTHVLLGVGDVEKTSVQTMKHNAFREISEQIDARGNATILSYNTLGKLTTKQDPFTDIVGENGGTTRARPTTRYFYDKQGRLVGTQDANSFLAQNTFRTTQAWTAEDANGKSRIGTEFHVDGGKKFSRFDAFGDQIESINENFQFGKTVKDTSLAYTTSYTYDKEHRVTDIYRPKLGSIRGYDHYDYDSVGNRIDHKTSPDGLITNVFVEKTFYDALGRVEKTVSAAERTTLITYQAATVVGLGGKSTAGILRTTKNGNLDHNTLIDELDMFGHVTKHTDLGGVESRYNYNIDGLLISQTSGRGQNINYDYYSNGKLKRINDKALTTYSSYQYDSDGNKINESYAADFSLNFHQQATIAYDELGRIKSVIDPKYALAYSYDAAGNRRHLVGATPKTPSQDYWYQYDGMNRLSISMGQLDGAQGGENTKITRGTTGSGVSFEYNRTDQITKATYARDQHYERFAYNLDGFLYETYYGTTTGSTSVEHMISRRTTDLMGRVKSYNEYTLDNNTAVLRQYWYDKDGKTERDQSDTVDLHQVAATITTKTVYDMLSDGTLYHSKATTGPSSTEMFNGFEWWDSAQQSTITLKAYSPSVTQEWAPGVSLMAYDINGHIKEALDTKGGRALRYVNNAQGLILNRIEKSST
ncbi:MAG: hypothetical protein V4532_09745, partial [Pseudomonadota bacterium]